MYRILYVVSGAMVLGGTETMIMNYYRHIDRSKIQIDFVCYGNKEGAYDFEIISLGGKIFRLPSKKENLFKNLVGLYSICKRNNYKIIHAHMDAMNYFPLLVAKLAGVPIRICHCHSTFHLFKNKFHFYFKELLRKKVIKIATEYCACAKAAGDWFYDGNSYTLIRNAIDVKRFLHNSDVEASIRKQFHVNGKTVIGHVGNFNHPKNQIYLVQIFKEYIEINKDAVLVLIGDGPDRQKIEQEIKRNNLENFVLLMGNRANVNEIIQMFDIFILVSFFEGLPVVLIEAQAAGIPCLVSDTVTREARITNLVTFLSISDAPSLWAKTISSMVKTKKSDQSQAITQAGYNIEVEAEKLQIYYDLKIRE